jgi:hypothetical protein
MKRDYGWVHTLLEEAENERMHLLTFIKARWQRGAHATASRVTCRHAARACARRVRILGLLFERFDAALRAQLQQVGTFFRLSVLFTQGVVFNLYLLCERPARPHRRRFRKR